MTTSRVPPLLFVVSLLLAAACGGGGDGGTTSSLKGPEDFCKSYAAAVGRKMATCGPKTEALALAQAPSFCRAIGWAAADGNVGLDSDAAKKCLDIVSAFSCEELANPPPAAIAQCATSYLARVPADGACTMSYRTYECIGGYCEADACNSPGKCRTYAALGEECDNPQGAPLCGPGLYCAFANGVSRCAAIPGDGAAGAGCKQDGDCQSGYYCYSSVCAARIAENEPCWSDETCAAGLLCGPNPGDQYGRGKCIRFLRVGSDCTTGAGQCVRGAFCASDGKCREWSGAGGACGPTPQGENRGCVGSWCDATGGATGTCRAFGEVSSTCTAVTDVAVCGMFSTCTGGTCVRSYCDEP